MTKATSAYFEDRRTMDTTPVNTLDTETFIMNPALPTDLKWGIRFDASGTVTLVLGMRDYGRGLYTSYFASLMAARLGIPLHRVRVYYSAIRPAVLQTPQPSCVQLHETDPGPIPRGVRKVIEEISDRVIEKGRLAFAAKAGVSAADVGFDQRSARFFVLDKNQSGSILEMAEIARATPPLSPRRVIGIESRRLKNMVGREAGALSVV
jgi:aerobic carbon-monoxide dehydrogenase large subunit